MTREEQELRSPEAWARECQRSQQRASERRRYEHNARAGNIVIAIVVLALLAGLVLGLSGH